MDSALFEHQGALLVDMSRPATAQRAFECGALFGSESPQLSANLAECLRTRLLEVTRRNRRSSGATTTTAPVAPALDATEALAWFAEAMRRGVQDDAVIVRGAALAALNWDEARAQDWAATGIVHGADPVQLWQTVVLAGVTCGRHDAADMGLQALAQSIPGDPRLAPLTILFEKGVTNETAGNLDIHQLRELARICAEVGSVEGLAPVATALLKQDPNDVEIRELYAEALETALLGSPGAPSLGNFHPTGAGKALLEMAEVMVEDDPDGRWRRRNLFARLRGGEPPEEIAAELQTAPLDLTLLSDSFCHMLGDAFLYRAQDFDAARHLYEFVHARGELQDPRPYRTFAFMTLLQGERFEGLAALLASRRISQDAVTPAEMTRVRDAYFPEAPLFGDCAEPDMTDPINESLEFLLSGDYDNAQMRAIDALSQAEQRPVAELEIYLILAECHARRTSPRALKSYRRAQTTLGELRIFTPTPAEHHAGLRLGTSLLGRALPIAHRAGLVGEAFHLIQQHKLDALRDTFAAAANLSPEWHRSYVGALQEGFVFERTDVCPPLLFGGLAEIPPEPSTKEPFHRPWAGELDQAVLDERLAAFEEEQGATWYPAQPVTVEQVRERLGAEDAVLELALLAEAAYVVLITRERAETFAVPLDQSLETVCRYAWTCVSNPPDSLEEWDAETDLWPLRVLYASLMTPLLHALEGKSRLIVAPMGGLHRVPFDALHSGVGFLGDRFEVVQVPSAGVFAQAQPQGSHELAALGLITADADWTGARAALNGLGEAVQKRGGDAAPLTGAEVLAEAQRAALVHISAPGFIDPDVPAGSPLFFGHGLAEAEHVTSLGALAHPELMSHLIVLDGLVAEPGCWGTDGEHSNPTAAMHATGAATVVATSWRSDATYAADLFRQFYDTLQQGEPVARAVNTAKRKVRAEAETSHPFFWAAPIVSGDADQTFFAQA